MPEVHNQPVALTPTTKARLEKFAKDHEWTLSAAACYLIEDGIAGEERRARLASEARRRPDIDRLTEEFSV